MEILRTAKANGSFIPLSAVDTAKTEPEYVTAKTFSSYTSGQELIRLPHNQSEALTLRADYRHVVTLGGTKHSETLPAGCRLFLLRKGCPGIASVWGVVAP